MDFPRDPTTGRPLAYRMEHENVDSLLRLSRATASAQSFADDVEIPVNRDFSWLPIRNQERIGSCQGHANVGVGMMCHWWATKKVRDFSELHAYICTQQIDGLAGRDVGSTIDGGLKYATERGYVEEVEVPYKGSNYPNDWRAITLVESDPKTRIKTAIRVNDWQQLRKGLAAGWSAIAGGPWFEVPSDGELRALRLNGMGGHAWYMPGTFRNSIPEVVNSWGFNWGRKGRFSFYESPFNTWLRQNGTFVFLVSELATPQVRDIDFTKELWG